MPSRLRSIIDMMLLSTPSLPQPKHRDEAMQRLGGDLLVLHHGDADIVRAGIAAVGLLAREIAAGHDAHAGLAPQRERRRFAAALRGDIEPEEEAARGTAIAVAVADDLIGEIEFLPIEAAVFLDMRLVAVGGDGDVLRRHRHLRRGDVAQFEIGREEAAVAGGEADAQTGQARALRQRVENDDVGEIRRRPLPACRAAARSL